MADKAEPTYEDLLHRARKSVVNAMDETGWRVGGWPHWAHVAVGAQATVYTIRAGRGFAEAAELVGADYGGFVVRDGWAPYRKFEQAFHQTCLAHLLRRCRELEQQAGQDQADFPRAVKQVRQQGLKLRDRHGPSQVDEVKAAPPGGVRGSRLRGLCGARSLGRTGSSKQPFHQAPKLF
jgi:transposase